MGRSRWMEIEALSGSRFKAALEFVREGHAVSYEQVGFSVMDGVLHVEAESPWSPENLTQERAVAELRRAKAVLESVLETGEFAQLVKGRPVRLSVIYDPGTSAIELCWLDGDTLRWAPGMRAGA